MLKLLKQNSLILDLVLTSLMIVLFLFLVNRAGQDSKDAQYQSLDRAIARDITSCYALEGAYPPDLQYMKDHYALSWDESLFFVDYQPVASNMRPWYVIIEVDNESEN